MPETFDNIDCSHFFGGKPGPTVRILLYTDDPEKVNTKVVGDRGLGVMLQHIQAHAPAFANLCFRFVSRNSTTSIHADQTLDHLIQTGDFDQIWFFGVHQGNRDNQSGNFSDGGPRSELEPAEIEALNIWMRIGEENGQRGGGLLMTGDHAEPLPANALFAGPAPASGLWSIGRALGEKTPRAGRMRRWDGPPRGGDDSQNTHFADANFNDNSLQYDAMPQRLNLTFFEQGKPHPLFFYQQGTFIEVFPDHMHEGAIRMPTDDELAIADEWPAAVRPQIVARGTDRSKGGIEVGLVAAYDGDPASVGRIVSDSTWHHYFNVNLNRFIPPGDRNSATDQIGQFYANLAVWLTPLGKRQEMARAMIESVVIPNSLGTENLAEELSNLGKNAYEALAKTLSPCELHELCKLLPEAPGISMETALASVIKKHHETGTHVETAAPAELELVTTA
ncbi:MAG TPA: hypothetical protein VJP89_13890 [Pyrinomonadaceae bacterium]|nr:hypothetical protein [Pyrinomonadaceae bacterium]